MSFLLLFVPLYAIWPAAEWFAIAQAFALSVAAWPIFLLASRVHSSERTGLLWAAIYLFNPFLLSAAAWDFHPVTLAVPLSRLITGCREKRLSPACDLLPLPAPDTGTIWTYGCWFWRAMGYQTSVMERWSPPFRSRPSAHGTCSGSLRAGTFAFRDAYHDYRPNRYRANNRYGWLGGSSFEIFRNIFLHPFWLLKTVISMDRTISYLCYFRCRFWDFFSLHQPGFCQLLPISQQIPSPQIQCREELYPIIASPLSHY